MFRRLDGRKLRVTRIKNPWRGCETFRTFVTGPMSEPGQHISYEFGDFRLDARRRLLFAKGVPDALSIKPKVFEAILYFVERPGELLEKDRLIADLWPGLVVEENNLTHVISVMRRVLGEARGENRYVATVPGRGYRFVAEVRRLPAQTPDGEPSLSPPSEERRPDSRRVAVTAITLACMAGAALLAYGWQTRLRETATSDLRSRTVAILPFENLSTEAGDEFVAFGIAVGVLHRLAASPDLTLIAQTSSFSFRGKPADARDIGRKLNARYLVEGSLQRSHDRLRVTAQLIDATTGGHVLSLRFTETIDDIFAVEDQISLGVAQALNVSLDEKEHSYVRFGMDAYLAFLHGQTIIANRPADAERAIEYFARAVELAPAFAAAYVSLADAHIWHAHGPSYEHDATTFRQAASWLATALQLDDTLGEAYVLRADLTVICTEMTGCPDRSGFHRDRRNAEADFRKGLALSPNYGMGHEHFAEFLLKEERMDEGFAEIDRARLIDPMTPRNHYVKGFWAMFGDEALFGGQAEGLFLHTLQLAPDFHLALLRLGEMRWRQGRFAEAVLLGERAVAIEPKVNFVRSALVDFYLDLEDLDAARSVLAEQPQAVRPIQSVSLCLYEREAKRAGELVSAGGFLALFADDLEAYAIRDAALATGRVAREQRELRAPPSDPAVERYIYRKAVLAHLTFLQGDRAQTARLAEEMLSDIDQDPFHKSRLMQLSYPRAMALTLLDRKDQAITVLDQSFTRGFRKRWWYAFDREPTFGPLRTDPRFQTLAAKARAHAAAERKLLENMRARGEVPARTTKGAAGPRSC
jgi:TolB-like protein/DNA-binding winged helix-turn-helix (wHTH) protein